MNNIFKSIMASALFVVASISHATTIQKTIQIYNQLIKENYLRRPLKFIVVKDENTLNAWVNNKGEVSITTAVIHQSSPAEVALVLGHELAHFQFSDQKVPESKYNKTKKYEDRADRYGNGYATALGYSSCKQAYFFIRLYKLYGNGGGPNDPHSANLTRFWRIYKHCNQ